MSSHAAKEEGERARQSKRDSRHSFVKICEAWLCTLCMHAFEPAACIAGRYKGEAEVANRSGNSDYQSTVFSFE